MTIKERNDLAANVAAWHVSRDGRFVAGLGKEQDLYIVPVSGDSARRVVQLDPDEAIIRWATDNRTIFVSRKGTRMTVSRIDVATGRRTPWRTFEPQLRALDRVLLQLFNYDRANLSDNWNQRHWRLIGHLRHKRLYDTFRCFAGKV